MLENLQLPHPVQYLITISPEQGARHQVADYSDLRPAARAKNVEVYEAESYSLKNAADRKRIAEMAIDIAFVIGWQRLIPADVLDTFRIGAFGMHGSAMNLPLGRGRSPMNWSIIEGRRAFYTNLFQYDAGIDSGHVVDTLKFAIGPRDTAESMHFKNTLAMKFLIERNIGRLVRNEFTVTPQDNDIRATYYPKRSPADGLIDWSQDVYAIERFVRAVTRPFDGAFSFAGSEKILIWDAQVLDLNDFGYDLLPAGSIAAVFENGKFLVKCFGGLLLVNSWEADFQPKSGVRMDNNGREIPLFPRNRHGNFDIPE